MIHTVKGFGIVNKAEIDVFLELFTVRVTQILIPKGSEFYFGGGVDVLIGAPEHPLGSRHSLSCLPCVAATQFCLETQDQSF